MVHDLYSPWQLKSMNTFWTFLMETLYYVVAMFVSDGTSLL